MGALLSYRVRRLFNDRPNPTFVVKPWHKIVNWGNRNETLSTMVSGSERIINSFSSVATAANKLTTFRALENKDGIRIPVFTTDHAVAANWLRGDGVGVVARTVLSGHSGAGIVLVSEKGAEIPPAPLYTQYIKKQNEYRIHVAFGEVIDVQEKRKRRDIGEDFQVDFQVRNHHTGWVYCREGIQLPGDAATMAVAAVRTLGLDFGAVDLIYNAKRNETYVLEVNTAPGLEGTTVEKYAEAFVRELRPDEDYMSTTHGMLGVK